MISISAIRCLRFGWVLVLVLAALLARTRVEAQGDEVAAKPNVLFILADDVGRDAIGCYGGESYATPVIDELARGGKQFEHAYSMAVCHPSRTCLLSGQYPARLQNPAWGSFPAEVEARALGSVMKAAGYATAVAGKWQMCLMKDDLDQPRRMGFDEWALFGWHEGPRFRSPMIYHNGEVMKGTGGKYGPDLYVDFLIEFIKRQHKAAKPFFAYYPMALAHDVTDDIGEPVPFFADGKWESFGEMVESMDRQIGRLVAALDELGLRDNTLIVYTTDNGSPKASYLTVDEDGKFVRPKVTSIYKGKQIVGGKGELTDWGTRVPMIANWPGKIPAGSRSDALIDFADFVPTFAELGQAPLERLVGDAVLDGRSFLDEMSAADGAGDSDRDKPFAYAEHGGLQFVRNHEWKLYSNGSFYDLRGDADERKLKPMALDELDAPGSEAHAALKRELDALPESVQPKRKSKTKKVAGPKPLAVPSPALENAGFGKARQLFDGKTLDGWRGVDGAWEVRDGAIWCTGNQEGGKNWLIYEGEVPDDFVLELEYQFVAGNSGVQVRSAEIDEPFHVRGYQVEIAGPDKMGLWHHSLSPSKLRSHLATAGQSTVYAESGEKTLTQVHPAAAVQAHIRADGEWNSLKITVIDSTFIQEINGSWFATLKDEDIEHARSSGVIALQDHGKGTVAAFRKIRLRTLTQNE